MAVEVKELVIRAIVSETKGKKQSARPPAGPDEDLQLNVEQVLKIMQKSRRR